MKQLFFIISVLLGISMFGQQEALFTQYYLNDMGINPAISGSKAYNPLIIQTRQQWAGFEGAPLTSKISYHGALDNRSAMGGYLMFDKEFPTMQANLHLNYAYHIPLNYDKVNLSFGLGAEARYYEIDFNKGDLPPGYDPAFSTKQYNRISGDASSGVYLYARNFHSGFSVSNIFESSFNTPVFGSPYQNSKFRIYYGMGAYRFNIMNNDWQLEPSFLIRKMRYQSSMTDLTTRLLYLENTWAGLTYRTNGTGIFAFGFEAYDMHISYSYDHTFLGEIMQHTYGTHELCISFRIEAMATERHIGFSRY